MSKDARLSETSQQRCVGALKALEHRYTWVGYINSGTYGSVYAGKSTVAPFNRVAAKVVLGNANGTMCSALRELRASLCTSHVGIVAPKEVHIFTDATVVFIMSLYDGTLRDVINRHNSRRPRFSIREAAWVFASVARGLREAHRYGFTHRDIKPENIFVRDNDVCLGDWGLGRDNVKTRSRGVNALTPHVISTWYAPPEVLSASTSYLPAVDIWSVGMLLLELLADGNLSRTARRETFFDDTIVHLVGSTDGSVKVRTIRATLRREVPSDVVDLLSAMLAYEPARRPCIEVVCRHRFVATADISTATSFPVVSNRITRSKFNAITDYHRYGPSVLASSFIPQIMPAPRTECRFPTSAFCQIDLLRAWWVVHRMRQASEVWVLVMVIANTLGTPPTWPDVTPLQMLGVYFLLAFHSVVVVPQHITSDKLRLCDGMEWSNVCRYETEVLTALHGAVPHAPAWFQCIPTSKNARTVVGVIMCLTELPFQMNGHDIAEAVLEWNTTPVDDGPTANLICTYITDNLDTLWPLATRLG